MMAFVASVLSITSCKKGDDGPPGTANVKYSEWFTPATYKKDTVFGQWGFNYTMAVPGITQDILDKGTVLVFGKLKGYNAQIWPADQVAQLPITVTYQTGGTTNDTWSGLATPGNLKIRFVNDRNIYTTISTTHQFRYIIIPGGLPAGRGTASASYEEICRMYGVPE
jgi:hypothetical protein